MRTTPRADRYGSERLGNLLERLRKGDSPARGIVDAVFADLESFVRSAEPADDITVLALRWPRHANG